MMTVKKAKQRMDSFNPRGSKCPICKKEFRTGCNHNVAQAETRLFEDYVKALARTQQVNG